MTRSLEASVVPRDTSREAYERQRTILRAMTSVQRLRLAAEMSEEVRQLAEAGRRKREAK